MNLRNKSTVLFLLLAGTFAGGGAAYSGKFKFDDRWNSRFVTDSPSGEAAKNDTLNLSTGTKVKEDGSSVPAPASSADTQSYGTGDINCRDSVLKLKRTDDPANSETSELTVHEIKDTNQQVFACTSALPKMLIKGQPVDKGNMTLKCNNGQLRIIASTCDSTATPPLAGPSSGSGGGAAAAPAPPAPPTGCPAGNSVSACSSCCSDGTNSKYFTCNTKSGSCGQNSFRGQITYRTCQNGRLLNVSSGACGN